VNVRPRPRALWWRPHKFEKKIDRARFRSWFEGKELTSDWSSANFTMWRRVLTPLRNEPLRILEIGSWEGRSTIFFLSFFPNSTITCVDTFGGSETETLHSEILSKNPDLEARFDRNVATFGARVEKRRGLSQDVLAEIQREKRQFDLAYIDGDHRRDAVMADTLKVWPMVVPGGVVIWDDYEFGRHFAESERPRPAIDAFLRDHAGQYRKLARTYQMAVEKLG
jgi:predicted O-methyltransferase YrrM